MNARTEEMAKIDRTSFIPGPAMMVAVEKN